MGRVIASIAQIHRGRWGSAASNWRGGPITPLGASPIAREGGKCPVHDHSQVPESVGKQSLKA